MNEESKNRVGSSFFDGGSKTLFYTGLFLGIAGTLVVMMGYMLFGGFSLSASTNTIAKQNSPSVPAAPSKGGSPTAKAVAKVQDGEHIRGAKDAKVTMIEYSDFECPFCSRHLPSVKQALQDFPKDVRLVYRHFPLTSLHPSAQKGAEASECVADQGGNDAFWDFHDRVFVAQKAGLSVEVFKKIAGDMGLDQKKFNNCLDSGEKASVVAKDVASGNDAGVTGTPATFINGTLVSGAVPYATLKTRLQSAGAKE